MIYAVELHKLPFVQNEQQIIYTEGTYHAMINDFIRSHYSKLKTIFKRWGYEFCYLPLCEQEVLAPDILNYYAPWIGKTVERNDIGNDYVLQFMVHPENKVKIQPSILFYNRYTRYNLPDEADQYRGYVLDWENASKAPSKSRRNALLLQSFEAAARGIHDYIQAKTPQFQRVLYRDAYYEPASREADEDFGWESRQLIREIEERVDKLKQMGVNLAILEQIVHGKDQLSRLVVTKELEIKLPDYDATIMMRPLPKAVYLLFLKHHEGIRFKELPEHRDELMSIYEKLRRGPLSDKEQQSVVMATDPLNNSINEKCARIREAFVAHFDDRLARYYYIDGNRGETKRIALPENLITWES